MAKENKKNRKGLISLLGLLLIISGVGIAVVKTICDNNQNNNDDEKVVEFFEEKKIIKDSEPSDNSKKDTGDIKYMAAIEIPKIKLKRGLVSRNSKLNNVNYNIQILDDSKMPDEENSNFILSGHAGNSRVSFFRNLPKVAINDFVFIYYKNIKYTYKIVDKYEIPKTGEMSINLNVLNKTLTLITCKFGTKKQIVVIAEIVSEEDY